MNFLSLNLLVLSPLIAAVIIASPIFGGNRVYIRRFAKTFSVFHFLYSLFFVLNQKAGTENLYTELKMFGKNWLESWGISFSLGLDGFTALLVSFTSLIFLLAFIMSKSSVRYKHKMYYSLMFCLMTSVLGIFTAKDIFLFFVFWEAELIPAYLLIAEWGSENSKKSAMKYLLYTFGGSIFIFAAIIGLYYYGFASNGELSSSIDYLRVYLSDGICPVYMQVLMFAALFIGFTVKLPVFPLHVWLSDSHTDSLSPVSIIMSAILLNTGAYGIIRFNLELFPEIFTQTAPYIMIIAVINILWASFAAFGKNNIKSIISYLNIAFMGIFLLGLSSLNKVGIDGALFILFAHGITVTGLFMISEFIYQNVKTYNIHEIGGMGKKMPFLMLCSSVVCFSAAGIPFTCMFPAAFLSYTGAVCADYGMLYKIFAALGIIGIVLISACIIKLFHSVFCRNKNMQITNIYDISGHKATVAVTVVLCIIILGIFPDSFISVYDAVVENMLEILRV